MPQPVIKFEHVGKLYRLGTVGTGTLSHDLRRWWITSVRGKEDPYLKIGETNDRSKKGTSDYVYALKDIDFEVQQGDVIGIIGKNGAGKSTLLKLLSRVTCPTTGKIYTRGRIASLLEVGTGFHPELTGRENIYMNGSILGMKKWEIDRSLDEIVDFSGCERYLDTPVKRYSSGMTVRLGFAIAAHLNPEILVVDEVLAVGDAEFQKKAIGKMQDVSQGQGRTVLFVSHNMESIRALCKTGLLLKNGIMDYTGDILDTIYNYIKSNSLTFRSSKKFKPNTERNFNFLQVELLKNGEIAQDTFDVFDTITIKVKYHLKQDDCNNCVYVIIHKETTPLIFIIDTTRRPDLLECRKAGTYEMSFSLPSPLLKPGNYSVELRYTLPRIIDYQKEEDCLSFDVALFSMNEYNAGFAKNRVGIIAIDPIIAIKQIKPYAC